MRISLFLLFSISFNFIITAQWNIISTNLNVNDITDYYITSDNHGFIKDFSPVNVDSRFLRSQDNFSTLSNITPSFLSKDGISTNIEFINDSVGFITDSTRIFKTIDSGNSYSLFIDSIRMNNQNLNSYALEVINDTFVYTLSKLTNNQNTPTYFIKHTSNRYVVNSFWDSLKISFFFNNRHIQFVNSLEGYVALSDTTANSYRNYLFKTVDGGINWNSIFSSTNRIDAYNVIDSTTIFISTNFSLLKSNDGGANWTTINYPVYNHRSIYDIQFYDQNIGYLAADSGLIYRTSDGGSNWSLEFDAMASYPNLPIHELRKIQIVDSNIVYCNSDYLIFKRGGMSTSLNQKDINQSLTIYPNPVQDVFYFNANESLLNARIQLINFAGQIISDEFISEIGRKEYTLPLENGVYFIKTIDVKGKITTTKFIKI